jgi:hypothetical protein
MKRITEALTPAFDNHNRKSVCIVKYLEKGTGKTRMAIVHGTLSSATINEFWMAEDAGIALDVIHEGNIDEFEVNPTKQPNKHK